MSRLLKALSKLREVIRILMEEHGLTDSEFLRPLDNPDLARHIVNQWKSGPPQSQVVLPQSAPLEALCVVPDSESQARCRELFGEDFFGMSEVVSSYGHGFSAKESEERKPVRILENDRRTPLSEERSWDAIRRCYDEAPGQFVLCAGVPHSVCDVHAKHTDVFHFDLRKNPWFDTKNEHRWSKRVLCDYWFLLKKGATPDIWDMPSDKGEKWLSKIHPCLYTALPEHVTYGSVLCVKATHGRLKLYAGERWGRTRESTANRTNVLVGFHDKGFRVGYLNSDRIWNHDEPSLWTS